MKLLFEDGLEKALQGITTLEEVSRVCEERVEVKRSVKVEEVQPYIPEVKEEKKEKIVEEPKAEPKDLEDYTKKIMEWLSKKR
jgi:hypothetical protein